MRFNPAELHMAIIYKNFDAVSHIVDSGGNLNQLWRGTSPVSCALYARAFKILEYLVKQGADVNLRTLGDKMEPPLFGACRLGRTEAVYILLKSPVIDIEQRDFFNRTALWAAARYSSFDMVELLLDNGADIRAAQDYIECPLLQTIYMLERVSRWRIACLLIKRGCYLDLSDKTGPPLLHAVRHGNRELFELLVSAGCRVKNEEWLSYSQLPLSWKEDESFCQWICSLHNNPSSLLHLSACSIRNVFVNSHKNINPQHVEVLPIPKQLKNLLLLET